MADCDSGISSVNIHKEEPINAVSHIERTPLDKDVEKLIAERVREIEKERDSAITQQLDFAGKYSESERRNLQLEETAKQIADLAARTINASEQRDYQAVEEVERMRRVVHDTTMALVAEKWNHYWSNYYEKQQNTPSEEVEQLRSELDEVKEQLEKERESKEEMEKERDTAQLQLLEMIGKHTISQQKYSQLEATSREAAESAARDKSESSEEVQKLRSELDEMKKQLEEERESKEEKEKERDYAHSQLLDMVCKYTESVRKCTLIEVESRQAAEWAARRISLLERNETEKVIELENKYKMILKSKMELSTQVANLKQEKLDLEQEIRQIASNVAHCFENRLDAERAKSAQSEERVAQCEKMMESAEDNEILKGRINNLADKLLTSEERVEELQAELNAAIMQNEDIVCNMMRADRLKFLAQEDGEEESHKKECERLSNKLEEAEDRVKKLEKNKKKLLAKVKEVEESCERLRTERNQLKTELNQSKEDEENAKETIDKSRREIARLGLELGGLHSRVTGGILALERERDDLMKKVQEYEDSSEENAFLKSQVVKLEKLLTEKKEEVEKMKREMEERRKEIVRLVSIDKDTKERLRMKEEEIKQARAEALEAHSQLVKIGEEMAELRTVNGILATTTSGQLHEELQQSRQREQMLNQTIEAMTRNVADNASDKGKDGVRRKRVKIEPKQEEMVEDGVEQQREEDQVMTHENGVEVTTIE